jgi:DNA-binding response OmpR family regulator
MNIKILIVEDDKDLREGYKFVFEKSGYKVEVASDGVEALAKASAFDPVVILLDILLPKMNGMEVLRRLRSQEKTRKIKVVMLTGLKEEEKVGEALFAGAVNYLVKSDYTFSELVSVVSKILDGKE